MWRRCGGAGVRHRAEAIMPWFKVVGSSNYGGEGGLGGVEGVVRGDFRGLGWKGWRVGVVVMVVRL